MPKKKTVRPVIGRTSPNSAISFRRYLFLKIFFPTAIQITIPNHEKSIGFIPAPIKPKLWTNKTVAPIEITVKVDIILVSQFILFVPFKREKYATTPPLNANPMENRRANIALFAENSGEIQRLRNSGIIMARGISNTIVNKESIHKLLEYNLAIDSLLLIELKVGNRAFPAAPVIPEAFRIKSFGADKNPTAEVPKNIPSIIRSAF